MRRAAIVIIGTLVALSVQAADSDTTTLRRFGLEVGAQPGWVIAADPYERKWLKGNFAMAVNVGLRYSALPCDSDAYARDFGYPTFSVGVKYGMNHSVTMHRESDPAWGLLEPVDYTSRMGNTVTVYGSFERPFFRTRRWQADYTLSFGVGYTKSKYNTHDAIDNELIGSRWLIYFGAGLHATYRITHDIGLRAGLEFYHHSNGALNRPNKGANVVGPSLSVVYEPYYEELASHGRHVKTTPFKPFTFMDFAVGIGAKTLNEDWQRTQFDTPPGESDYRTSKFRRYITYSVQASVMRRYARRWASGAGVDVFYGSYASHVEKMDLEKGINIEHSPWSLGLSAKHRVYYHNLALHTSLGIYLFRRMGDNAKQVETPYYEHIGLHYSFPSLQRLTVGIDVKAHKTKADYTELVVSFPIRL
jgi:hypothetical protein